MTPNSSKIRVFYDFISRFPFIKYSLKFVANLKFM
nr:MAG TPA: hypothetical protein [Caudoviricetes sp.]